MQNLSLRIDIVSDVVCPWCIIGYKQLEKALEKSAVSADIHWHPFELNPNMPEDGENLRKHLAAKYGTTLEQSVSARARLTSTGEELGFSFNYSDDMMMYNTFRAHQLLHWADQLGKKHQLKLALFEKFFTHRENVSDPDVLVQTAVDAGLDGAAAAKSLQSGEFAQTVREQEQQWISRGVSGVPAMIFDNKHLVTGARGVEGYTQVIKYLSESEAA